MLVSVTSSGIILHAKAFTAVDVVSSPLAGFCPKMILAICGVDSREQCCQPSAGMSL